MDTVEITVTSGGVTIPNPQDTVEIVSISN